MSGPAGILYDIDGVLVTSWRALPGASDAVRSLAERGLRRAFLTNTTSRTQAEIAERLCPAGLEVGAHELVPAARFAVQHPRRHHPGARTRAPSHGDTAAGL